MTTTTNTIHAGDWFLANGEIYQVQFVDKNIFTTRATGAKYFGFFEATKITPDMYFKSSEPFVYASSRITWILLKHRNANLRVRVVQENITHQKHVSVTMVSREHLCIMDTSLHNILYAFRFKSWKEPQKLSI